MKQTFRKNTFETNSSSIHCLSVMKDCHIEANDAVFKQAYEIYPYENGSLSETERFVDPESKLRYLWTLRCKGLAWGYVDDEQIDKFTSLLKAIFPNAHFYDIDDPEYMEDFEYVFEEEKLYDEQFIRDLFLDDTSTVVFTTRDMGWTDWKGQDFVESLRKLETNPMYEVLWSEG